MMTSSDSGHAVAGGLARHIPVLVRPAVEFLDVRSGGVYVDATFGAGGYTREILAAANCRVVALDRDQSAIARGADLVQAAGGRLVLVEDKFSNLRAVTRSCGHDAVDGVVFDLGVSSMQLDQAERGFSFRHDGPLDMRMGRAGPSAADVVASASERDLAAILAILGEERHARAVARAIVAARADAPIRTTRALADIVARVVHARPGAIHPATRTFQALRIFVNEELAELAEGLGRGRTGAQARRPAGGRDLPFARGPHRQVLSRRAQPPQRAFAPPSGRGASGRHVPRADQAADRAGRGGDRRQSARALGQAAGGRAHRCADRPARIPGLASARAVVERGDRAPGIGAAAMMRLLNICVIVALVLAAADVYKIKFESTRQAQRVAKLRMEIRREHDAIATLRAEWAKLDNPARIQSLTRRHLPAEAGRKRVKSTSSTTCRSVPPTSCRWTSPIRSGR